MCRFDNLIKRMFDILISFTGMLVLFPLGVLIYFLIHLSSKGPAIYRQKRIGRFARPFFCLKFRTMYPGSDSQGSVTTGMDSRITPIGKLLRKYKLDELPQLWNVFTGKMSFVGPRPDVPGYADVLTGEERMILALRPGITGPASIFFRNEEVLLSNVSDPKRFNDEVLWPQKVKMNLEYYKNWSFWKDIGYILITILPFFNKVFRLVPVTNDNA